MAAGSALITTAGSVVTVIIMITVTVTVTIAVAVAVTVITVAIAVAVIIAVTIGMTTVITVIMVASIASTAGRTTMTMMVVAVPAVTVTAATTTTVTLPVRTTTRSGMTWLFRAVAGFVACLMTVIASNPTRRFSLLYFYFPITDLGRMLFELFEDSFCNTFILVANKAETMTLRL